jgi:hypothetical protein
MIQIGRQIIDENKDVRIYHTRVILTQLPVELAFKFQPVENTLVEAILAIDGVSMVELHPYHVVIMKAQQFTWTEIEPAVKILLSSFSLPVESTIANRPDEIE